MEELYPAKIWALYPKSANAPPARTPHSGGRTSPSPRAVGAQRAGFAAEAARERRSGQATRLRRQLAEQAAILAREIA
ncbi:hypothetical protein, partial [Burkholderia pseudomallei]|uniref:hypothetical protein n=1 Tax=Burkholderia pseudomallei TaxID=28450 RepID=UPI001C801DB1